MALWPSPESNCRKVDHARCKKRKADCKVKFIDLQKPGEKVEILIQQQVIIEVSISHSSNNQQARHCTSIKTRQVVILTAPWEERMEEANE